MKTTRRDTIKLAAAGSVIAFTITPAEARKRLAEPARATGSVREPEPYQPANPEQFAMNVEYSLFNDEMELAQHICPEEWIAMRQATAVFSELLPSINERGTAAYAAWNQFQEAVMGLMNDTHTHGVRVGAACEHLRLAMIGPVAVCPKCDGLGAIVKDANRVWWGHGDTRCPRCGGSGKVPAGTFYRE